MTTNDIDALIIRNLGDLEAAAKHCQYTLQTQIAKELDAIGEGWARKQGWEHDCNWDTDEGIWWVAPPDWKVSGNGDDTDTWFAKYKLWAGAGDNFEAEVEKDFFWLTRLCGVGRGTIVLSWSYESAGFESAGLAFPKPRWKKFVPGWIEPIRKTGFNYEEGTRSFSRPVKIDKDRLASAIQDENIEGALEPFRQALDQLLTAKPVFDKMLESAKREAVSS